MARSSYRIGFRWSVIKKRGVYSSAEWFCNSKPRIEGKSIVGGAKFRIIGRAKAAYIVERAKQQNKLYKEWAIVKPQW